MIPVQPETRAPRLFDVHTACWCGLLAAFVAELINARIGTGRFSRCKLHARRDLRTGDFKLTNA